VLNTQTQTPQAVLTEILGGQILSRCIGLVAELAIADRLAAGPQPLDVLAKSTKSDPDTLYRVLRTLVGFGIFSEMPGKRFQNNFLSEVLRTDASGSMRHFARWISDPLRWAGLGNLDYSVRTGNPGVLKGREESSPYEIMREHPASVETFNQAMTSLSTSEGHAVIQAYDFSPYRRIVDVGGGHGFMALLIAQAAPEARVTVVDQPGVVNGAKGILRNAGVDARVILLGGNYLENVAGPADLILMKNIIHDEPDDKAIQLLRNCRAAVERDGQILVIESVITDGPQGNDARILDIEMLIGPGGRQRTREEHMAILGAAGLYINRVIPLETGASIIEARVLA